MSPAPETACLVQLFVTQCDAPFSFQVGFASRRSPARSRYAPLGGNCLRACIASIVGAPIDHVPDPTVEYSETLVDWFSRYDARLRKESGYRLERFPVSVCPPRNPNQLWIAGISMSDHDADHVVVARGCYVIHDPLGEFIGSLPWNRVIDGMIVRPTRRVVPVWSPHRGGHAVVPT